MKKDAFGRTELVESAVEVTVRRDAGAARFPLRWLARHLLAREARALAVLDHVAGVPHLLKVDRGTLEREFIAGKPMQVGRPSSRSYFVAAARLVRQLHRAGIAHNDLAKEPNFLCTSDGKPAVIDFQLSTWSPQRGRFFRALAREDLRHLLKHKRTYLPHLLTERERNMLDNPAWFSRLWMTIGKPVYLFVTRRLMGWQDREGAGDRV